MFDSSLGFSLLISTIVTVIMYVATRTKNKSEQEQKDKQNDMIILFAVCFMVIMVVKLGLSGLSSENVSVIKPSSVVSKVIETKGGQCPF